MKILASLNFNKIALKPRDKEILNDYWSLLEGTEFADALTDDHRFKKKKKKKKKKKSYTYDIN